MIIKRGKSGQYRVPYFLTGRVLVNKNTDSATENNRQFYIGKGEKVKLRTH